MSDSIGISVVKVGNNRIAKIELHPYTKIGRLSIHTRRILIKKSHSKNITGESIIFLTDAVSRAVEHCLVVVGDH